MKINRKIFNILFVVLLFSVFAENGYSQKNNTTSEIKQLLKEIRKEEAELKKLRGQKATTVKRIAATQSKINNYRKILRTLDNEIYSLSERLKVINEDIKKYRKNIDLIKKDVSRSNIFVIDNLGYSYIKIITTTKKAENTVKTLEIMSKANDFLNEKVVELNSSIEKLNELTSEQKSKLNSLSSMKREKDSAIKALNREQLEYNRELTLLRNDEAGRIEYIEMLSFQHKELDSKIKTNSYLVVNSSNREFVALKGKMAWPITGKVIEKYGNRYIKEANVNMFNKGIKILPSSSSDVLNVYTGTVIFADYMKGFENLVVVSHGGAYYTVYGNLSYLNVSNGDKIGSGETLGRIEVTDDKSSSSLYFEIRQKEEALNPLEWLVL